MNLFKSLFLSLCFAYSGNTTDLMVNLPIKNLYFVGRNAELSQIKRSLKDNERHLLWGSGGIGKTQIAKAYAWSNTDHYDFIWWINANQSMEPQLITFAREWNTHPWKTIDLSKDSKILLQNITRALSVTDKKGLIVFDDLYHSDHGVELLQAMYDQANHPVIITTRNGNMNNQRGKKERIQEFSRQESMKLLKKLSPEKYRDENDLNLLAETLKDYPLSLAQAIGYIEKIGLVDVDKYIQIYRQKSSKLSQANYKVNLTLGKDFTDGYYLTTELTTLLAMEALQKESPEALTLLQFMALLSNTDIPETLIVEFFDGDIVKSTEAIASLLQYSLINYQLKKPENLYSIHDMLTHIIQNTIDNKNQAALKASQVVNHIIPDKLNQSVGVLSAQEYYLSHIGKLWQYSLEHKIFSADLIDIKVRQLEYVLTEKRNKQASLKIINEIEALLKKTTSVPPITHARFLLMKAAFSAWMLGNFEQSIEEALAAEKYLHQQKIVRNEELMMLLLRLSQNYVFQGDINNALIKLSEAEALIEKEPLIDSGNKSIIYQAKGVTLWDKGELEQSLLYLNKCEHETRQAQFYTSIVGTLDYKTRLLINNDCLEEAYNYAEEAEKVTQNLLPANSYFSSVPYVIKANYFCKKKELVKASQNILTAISMLQTFYPEHTTQGNRRLGFAYLVAGNIAFAEKDYIKALAWYQKAEEMYFTGMKYQKIKEVSDLYVAMAKSYLHRHNNLQAVIYRDKHEQLFGEEHPNSIALNYFFNKKLS